MLGDLCVLYPALCVAILTEFNTSLLLMSTHAFPSPCYFLLCLTVTCPHFSAGWAAWAAAQPAFWDRSLYAESAGALYVIQFAH